MFRLTLLPAGIRTDLPLLPALREDVQGTAVTFDTFLLYDQDLWRYLWEGHVWASGFNPYAQAPEDPVLDSIVEADEAQGEVWSEIRDRVTYPEIPALYPPLAQMAFRVSHATFPGSVIGWKAWMVLFECVSGLFVLLTLRRLEQPVAAGLLLFAWNPLLIKSFAGSGHYDAIVVLTLSIFIYALVNGQRILAHFALGFSLLAKFVPIILFFLLQPVLWTGTAALFSVILLGYIPFLDGISGVMFSTAATFAREWRFNGGPYLLFETFFGVKAAMLSYVTVVVGVIYLFRKYRNRNIHENLRSLLWVLGLSIVVSPVVDPWYITWLLPLACVVRDRVWLAYSGIVFFAFFIMFDGVERPWILAVEYLALILVGLLDHFFRKEKSIAVKKTVRSVLQFGSV